MEKLHSEIIEGLNEYVNTLIHESADPETTRKINYAIHSFYKDYEHEIKKTSWSVLSDNISIIIEYEDSHGEISKDHKVDIIQIKYDMEYGYTITGYCHLRESVRSLKASRMLQLTDCRSGEVFNKPLTFFDNMLKKNPPTSKREQKSNRCCTAGHRKKTAGRGPKTFRGLSGSARRLN